MRRAYTHKPLPTRLKRRRLIGIGLALLGLIGIIGLFQRPDSVAPGVQQRVEAKTKTPRYTTHPVWPTTIAAGAIGAVGQGVFATYGDEKPRPIASVAKIITALVLLEKHPLTGHSQGPDIPITPIDEQRYHDYIARNGSVAAVQAGVPISERQALEAMLLPSANNIADTAAVWGFGSLQAYHSYADAYLKKHGLAHTTVGGDASGLDPSTTSTPCDLIHLGELALNNKVLASIVTEHSAELPFAGTIPNYNRLVTQHGYTGLKPGDSIEAGKTLLFSTMTTFQGKSLHLIGVVLGGNDAYTQEDALHLMESATTTLATQP